MKHLINITKGNCNLKMVVTSLNHAPSFCYEEISVRNLVLDFRKSFHNKLCRQLECLKLVLKY